MNHRYPLRARVNGRVTASCKAGNQFASLALLALQNDVDDRVIPIKNRHVTHMLPEPLTRRQAMSGPEEEQWLEAEQSELKSMINNKVFEECLLSELKSMINNKVFEECLLPKG